MTAVDSTALRFILEVDPETAKISGVSTAIQTAIRRAYQRGYDDAMAKCVDPCALAHGGPAALPPLDPYMQLDFFDEKVSQWARL